MPYAIVMSAGFREIGAKGAALQARARRRDRALRRAHRRSELPRRARLAAARCTPASARSSAIATGGAARSRCFAERRLRVLDRLVLPGSGARHGLRGLDRQRGRSRHARFRRALSRRRRRAPDRALRRGPERRAAAARPRAGARSKRASRSRCGRSATPATGSRAAVSHTANLTEDYDFYRDAFAEGGFVEVREIYDLIDAAKAFRSRKLPQGRRVAVVTTSGGAGVLLADRCDEARLDPAGAYAGERLPAERARAVVRFARKPGRPHRRARSEPSSSSPRATRHVIEDANVDLAIVRSYPGARRRDLGGESRRLRRGLPEAAAREPERHAGSRLPAWAQRVEDAGVPCFETPSGAAVRGRHAL